MKEIDNTEEWPLYLLVYAGDSNDGEGKLMLVDDVAETKTQSWAIRGLGHEVMLVYKVESDGEQELVYFKDIQTGTEYGEWPDEEPINVSHYGMDGKPPHGR